MFKYQIFRNDNDDNQIIGRFCEFYSTDIKESNIDFEECKLICNHTPGCTHFTWQMQRENKCLLKEGEASKLNAEFNGDPYLLCGIVKIAPNSPKVFNHYNYYLLIPMLALVIICIPGFLFFHKNKKFNCKKHSANISNRIRLECVNNEAANNQNELDFNNFIKEECIGRGGCGTVSLCSLPLNNNRKYVVKHLDTFYRIEVINSIERSLSHQR